MTLLTRDSAEGPQTHAIIIGVGHYPFLKDGENPRFPRMGNLESPPISAVEIARWFLDEYDNPSAPRGTLDIYVSSADGPVEMQNYKGRTVEIDRATKGNVTEGIDLWSDRVDRDIDDIALFFFCGHGASVGLHDGLLLEDFYRGGEKKMFRNVINLVGLRDAMDICKARRQAYFSDACRNEIKVIDESSDDGEFGDKVITGKRKKSRHGDLDAPIFYSTTTGSEAYGRTGKSSVFTAALLDSLRRGAALEHESEWQIRTTRLAESLRINQSRICRQEGIPYGKPGATHDSNFMLHVLPGPPSVPVVVKCDPLAASKVADLECHMPDGTVKPRKKKTAGEWDVDVDYPDRHTFKASFAKGAGSYKNSVQRTLVYPPGIDVKLKVSK